MNVKGTVTFVIFGVIVLSTIKYFNAMNLTSVPTAQQTRLTMEVPEINGLVVGSSVQLRGVPIGQVSDIRTTVEGATVDFHYDAHYEIPVDTDVRLENLSALGEGYIGLIPRSATGPILGDGQRIRAEDITRPPFISELATSVVRVLDQLDPGALRSIVHETDVALPDVAEVEPNLARTASLLRTAATTMNGKGSELLDNFQALLRNAEFVGPALTFNTPFIPPIAGDIDTVLAAGVDLSRRGGAPIVVNFVNFLGRIEHLLDHSGGDLKVLMQSMLPYLNDISGALMNLDTGQIFTNLLAAVPEDGAVTLHVSVPPAGPPASPADAPPN